MVAHKDETQQLGIYAVCVICLVVTLVMVILRFVSRHVGRVSLQMEDWFMVGAWVSKDFIRGTLEADQLIF